MLKLKNYFFYSFSLFFFPIFLSFLILQARNQQIWLEKRTIRLNLPYVHLGRQPLKPLGSEVTHPPWPPSVHITNHHYHLHITLFYTTQDISQPTQPHTTYNISHTTTPTTYINNPYAQSHGHAGLMQAHADPMQAHADPMQAVMQSHVLSTPISVVCGCASITWSLIWAIFPSMTSLFDRLCRHMTWWLCILVQFWLY